MVVVRSVRIATLHRRRQRRRELRQQLLDAVDHLDDVGAGLPLDVQDHRRACRSSTRPACTFSASSTTSATSDSITGAPLR